MTQSDEGSSQPPYKTLHSSLEVAPGSVRVARGCSRKAACVSASRPGLRTSRSCWTLEKTHGVRRYACDASEPAAVDLLFQNVVRDLGAPTLVVHNIDGRVPGIFGKGITEADPGMVFETVRNSAFSAFLIGQQAAQLMRENKPNANGTKGTIIFTNASAALKGFPSSGAFAMACHAKSGLAQSMARE